MAKAPQANLREIGLEGFSLIDKFYGPPRRSHGGVFLVRQGHWVVQVPSDEMDDPVAVINSKDAAGKYGGVMIMNYSKGLKPQNRRVRPFET
ncbi:hypothetical protein L6164_012510 [Bauhinia variegata]|uniref:Uncharacterized protein n=1 Tax=Bauhinia variegata TaxID=167791 RepID=A0ACB9PAK3_BAUVA|nr:hypothetical protein L6164_012510 [Bauhinia variegata]